MIERIQLLILDSLGCGIFGSELPWTKILQDTLARLDTTTSVEVWGSDLRLSAPMLSWSTGHRCRASSSTTSTARACCTWAPYHCRRCWRSARWSPGCRGHGSSPPPSPDTRSVRASTLMFVVYLLSHGGAMLSFQIPCRFAAIVPGRLLPISRYLPN